MCFDRAAHVYDATRRPARPEVIGALAAELSDCSSVLELGVGTGRLALPLRERGLQVVGVDLSRKMLDQGRAKGLDRLVLGDVRRLPFRRRSVDAVLAVHVLHLIDRLRDVLLEASAIARKKLVSLVDRYEPATASITWAYAQGLRKRGTRSARTWVQPELGIAMLVPPRRLETLVRYEEQENADAALAALKSRMWAVTWDVPDDVHRAVVKELTRSFAGKTATLTYEICLLSWDAADFTESALERVGGTVAGGSPSS